MQTKDLTLHLQPHAACASRSHDRTCRFSIPATFAIALRDSAHILLIVREGLRKKTLHAMRCVRVLNQCDSSTAFIECFSGGA